MPLNVRTALAIALLVSVALASWLWSRQLLQREPPPPAARSGPLGYYLTDAEILGTDEEGRPLYKIRAENAEEVPGESRLVLTDVVVQYHPQSNVLWTVRAGRGEVPLDETHLDLSGDVELVTDPQDAGPMIIRTGRLRFDPNSFVVATAEPVSVFIGGGRLDAVGMRADLKADHLALESDVHGQFQN